MSRCAYNSRTEGNLICKRSTRNCISFSVWCTCLHACFCLSKKRARESLDLLKGHMCVCVCETAFLVDIFQINHLHPQDRQRKDAGGPVAAERVTLWVSSLSLRGFSQSVGWWQCESGLLQLPHIETGNVSFGLQESVTIEVWALGEEFISCVPNVTMQTHFQKQITCT